MGLQRPIVIVSLSNDIKEHVFYISFSSVNWVTETLPLSASTTLVKFFGLFCLRYMVFFLILTFIGVLFVSVMSLLDGHVNKWSIDKANQHRDTFNLFVFGVSQWCSPHRSSLVTVL